MDIIYLSPADLKPYPRNAKLHPPEQVARIAKSIREFGFRQPLVVDADNVVVIGHGRLLAAKELGLDRVPVTRADDLTEAQLAALRLADNKTNESDWDFSALEAELDRLKEEDFDMDGFGFGDTLPEIPANLDADEGYDGDKPIAVKLTFPNYTAYSMWEDELKQTAEKMGAEFALSKAYADS